MFNEEMEWQPPETRSQARESALQLLYGQFITGTPPAVLWNDVLPQPGGGTPVQRFMRRLVRRVYENRSLLDEIIMRHSENWNVDRIAVIDLLILRQAVCELLYFPEIPPKVSIDEAVELAKRYGTEKSSVFVNGILDAVLDELRRENRLQKNRRGLREK